MACLLRLATLVSKLLILGVRNKKKALFIHLLVTIVFYHLYKLSMGFFLKKRKRIKRKKKAM